MKGISYYNDIITTALDVGKDYDLEVKYYIDEMRGCVLLSSDLTDVINDKANCHLKKYLATKIVVLDEKFMSHEIIEFILGCEKIIKGIMDDAILIETY